MWRLGSNQRVPSPSLLTRSGEGRGGASWGRSRTPEASSWEGGAEDRSSSATSACGGEGRRKSGPIPSATDSERPPRPHLPGNRPPPSPAHSLPQPRAAARSPPPCPAPPAVPAGSRVREAVGRELSGPSHFRDARRVSPPPLEDDVDAEEEAAEACCCLAHSPPLNLHPTSGRDGVKRRRRWYFRVALPELRARQRPLLHPGGTWRTPDSPAGQRPAHLVFLLLRLGRRARSGALPPGFLLPSGLEAAAYSTVTWNPGT